MKQNTLEVFFTAKYFKIPNYQRDYAWSLDNIDELFEDIIEAIETDTSHYIGTFILSKKDDEDFYNVVDGQQRLTTLIILLNSLIENIDLETEKIINKDKFIFSNGRWKLELLNQNNQFFQQLLYSNILYPENKSQKLLQVANNHIKNRINNFKEGESYSIGQLINCIKNLEVMEFIEKDEGKAIRIFQTVNDRGKPLSNMEKAKSLLIYHSNRFLNGELDDKINDKFGEIFKDFNIIKEFAENNKISLINQKTFTEDSVMRYHFLAFENEKYDYNATVNYVLDIFLKGTLKSIKSDKGSLRDFINIYIEDLSLFFKSFVELLQRVERKKYYKVLSILDLSTFLYPLMIRLQARNLLDKQLPKHEEMTYLDLIETTDVRVYKTRGTDPVKDISYLARDSAKLEDENIESRLIYFINDFMSDSEFRSRLENNVNGNRALKHIFIEYDEYLLENSGKPPYSLDEIRELNNTIPTIEHIFPQEPRFDFPSRGFDSEEEYKNKNNRIGNFILLEKNINSSCQNKTPEQKVADNNLYCKSSFETTKKVTAVIKNRGNFFNNEHIDQRIDEMSNFCMNRWKI